MRSISAPIIAGIIEIYGQAHGAKVAVLESYIMSAYIHNLYALDLPIDGDILILVVSQMLAYDSIPCSAPLTASVTSP